MPSHEPAAPSLEHWIQRTMVDLVAWLLREGRHQRSLSDLIRALGVRLAAANVLVWRVNIGLRQLHAAIWPVPAFKQVVTEMLLLRLKVSVNRLPCLLRQFELHGMSGFALANTSSICSQTARGDVRDLDADDITPS